MNDIVCRSRSVPRALAWLLALVALSVLPPNPVAAAKPGGAAPACTGTTTFAPVTAAELQSALDCAVPGATVTLTAGTTYAGNFVLRYKSPLANGTTPAITIASSATADLPARRVGPADEMHMASLVVPAGATLPVLRTELKTLPNRTRRAASHYRFVGVKFATAQWVSRLVQLGTGTETLTAELPSDIAFDRSVFAGSAGQGAKQGLVANGASIVVTNSHFRDFKDTANDAQAIIIWNGAGPFRVENNYLEASGENLMVGGGDPTIKNLVPADIVIRQNHFFKPLAWTFETSTQPGTPFGKRWVVKNLFELKNAERVLVQGNVLENNWIQADQQGFAVLFSTRNQNGKAPWSRIRDVTFDSNMIKHSLAGLKVLVTDDTHTSGQLQHVVISNNLLVNINADAVGDPSRAGDRAGRLLQIMKPPTRVALEPMNLIVDANTAFAAREVTFSVWEPTDLTGDTRELTFTRNVVRHNACSGSPANNCGMSGEGTLPGTPSLSHWFGASYAVTDNVMFAGGQAAWYPAGNGFPSSVTIGTGSSIDLVTGMPLNGDDADHTQDYTVGGAHAGKGADWTVLQPLVGAATLGTPLAPPAAP